MTAYIIRRVVQSLIVFLLVMIGVFMMMRLLPGDPILMLVSKQSASSSSPAQIEKIRAEYGLDKPMVIQFVNWIKGVVHGDFGKSITSGLDVFSDIKRSLPITLHLGILALIISFLIGVPAGVICAVKRGTWIDVVVTTLANIGITIPIFWLGVLMMYLFALKLGWLPMYGYTSPFEDFWLNTKQIIMPVFCLAFTSIAVIARQARSSMLEVLHQDYIRTAWSKGLRERVVVMRHALKNGLIPVVVLTGLGLSGIIGGSVLIETVFNVPGMGRLAVSAMMNQDYPIIQGVILFFAAMVLITNLIVDLSYGWLDPRVQYQ
jgi:peptide/nickel transport system permease protein